MAAVPLPPPPPPVPKDQLLTINLGGIRIERTINPSTWTLSDTKNLVAARLKHLGEGYRTFTGHDVYLTHINDMNLTFSAPDDTTILQWHKDEETKLPSNVRWYAFNRTANGRNVRLGKNTNEGGSEIDENEEDEKKKRGRLSRFGREADDKDLDNMKALTRDTQKPKEAEEGKKDNESNKKVNNSATNSNGSGKPTLTFLPPADASPEEKARLEEIVKKKLEEKAAEREGFEKTWGADALADRNRYAAMTPQERAAEANRSSKRAAELGPFVPPPSPLWDHSKPLPRPNVPASDLMSDIPPTPDTVNARARKIAEELARDQALKESPEGRLRDMTNTGNSVATTAAKAAAEKGATPEHTATIAKIAASDELQRTGVSKAEADKIASEETKKVMSALLPHLSDASLSALVATGISLAPSTPGDKENYQEIYKNVSKELDAALPKPTPAELDKLSQEIAQKRVNAVAFAGPAAEQKAELSVDKPNFFSAKVIQYSLNKLMSQGQTSEGAKVSKELTAARAANSSANVLQVMGDIGIVQRAIVEDSNDLQQTTKAVQRLKDDAIRTGGIVAGVRIEAAAKAGETDFLSKHRSALDSETLMSAKAAGVLAAESEKQRLENKPSGGIFSAIGSLLGFSRPSASDAYLSRESERINALAKTAADAEISARNAQAAVAAATAAAAQATAERTSAEAASRLAAAEAESARAASVRASAVGRVEVAMRERSAFLEDTAKKAAADQAAAQAAANASAKEADLKTKQQSAYREVLRLQDYARRHPDDSRALRNAHAARDKLPQVDRDKAEFEELQGGINARRRDIAAEASKTSAQFAHEASVREPKVREARAGLSQIDELREQVRELGIDPLKDTLLFTETRDTYGRMIKHPVTAESVREGLELAESSRSMQPGNAALKVLEYKEVEMDRLRKLRRDAMIQILAKEKLERSMSINCHFTRLAKTSSGTYIPVNAWGSIEASGDTDGDDVPQLCWNAIPEKTRSYLDELGLNKDSFSPVGHSGYGKIGSGGGTLAARSFPNGITFTFSGRLQGGARRDDTRFKRTRSNKTRTIVTKNATRFRNRR